MKSKLYVSSVACLSVLTLVSCGGSDGSLSSNSTGATSASAKFVTIARPIAAAVDRIGNALPTVPGWPAYIAMGSVGGPNQTVPGAGIPCNSYPPSSVQSPNSPCVAGAASSSDAFVGANVDAVFKYNGVNGNGDPGVIDPPTLALRMTADFNAISALNKKPIRVVMVEYTSQLSLGPNYSDFTDLLSASFTGSVSGNTLTVNQMGSIVPSNTGANGTIQVGQSIYAASLCTLAAPSIVNGTLTVGTSSSSLPCLTPPTVGMAVSGQGVASGTRISAVLSGQGGTGSQYTVTPVQNLASTPGYNFSVSAGIVGGTITALGTGSGGVGTYIIDTPTSFATVSGPIISGGASTTNGNPTYLMSRHFATLGADAYVLNNYPVVPSGASYKPASTGTYGSIILNPDMLGSIQQSNGPYLTSINQTLKPGAINKAVDTALCLLTTIRTYTNLSNPNGLNNPTYYKKSYTGTPVDILAQMLFDGYPTSSFEGLYDAYWNLAADNYSQSLPKADGSAGGPPGYSQVGTWFNECTINPTYDTNAFQRPNFDGNYVNLFDAWVAANNFMIRALAPQGGVTFGWHENMWANPTPSPNGSGKWWLHQDLTPAQVASTYSDSVNTFLSNSAPSTMRAATKSPQAAKYVPDFLAFDQYENDDSTGWQQQATLQNARSWDNELTAVGQVSSNFGNMPIMLWQIAGSHLPNTKEQYPEIWANTPGNYAFSAGPVYFFGDSNLDASLSTLINVPSGKSINSQVGAFQLPCGSPNAYNCSPKLSNETYQQYLLSYQGQPNNYDWSKDNGKLALAAKNNVFAILWGGGTTTGVIQNFQNTNDNGWLKGKINTYQLNPQPLN